MRRQSLNVLILLFAVSVAMASPGQADETVSQSRHKGRVITSPRFDPDAKHVELFAGIEEGVFETNVIAMGPQKGNLLIHNTTSEPLTVEMPETFVAVHVLKQFQPNQFQQNGNANQNQQQGNQGSQQAVGGGPQQGNNQANQNPFGNSPGGNAPGNGNGFFSIPPERTIKISYVSACLEHGKADPTPRANYKLVRTTDYTKDRVLREVIAMVASGRLDAQAAQAAVWHRSDNLNWKKLAAKSSHTVLGKVPYFRTSELEVAQQIVSKAAEQADAQRPSTSTESAVASVPTPPR